MRLSDYEALFLHPENWRMTCGEGPDPAELRGRGGARRRWSDAHAHRHPARELLFCLKGEGCFGMNGRLYRCRPGSLFVIGPDAPHDNNYPVEASGLEHVWIRPLGTRVFLGWLRIDHGRMRQLHERLRVFELEDLGLHPARFAEGHEDDSPAYRLARLRMLAEATGLAILRGLRLDESRRLAAAASLPERVVRAICQHIESTAGRNVTLDFLAHFSGYSKYHLHRLFREQVGQTIHQYIDNCRRQRLRLLQAEGRPNRAIAQDLGFSCAAAFLRWRKKHGPAAG